MKQGIGWSVSAWIEGGPTIQATGVVEKADAYDRISVKVAAGTTVKVSVAPGTWADVSFLIIQPSVTDGSLKYSFKTGGPKIKLDATHSLIGAGAVSLFGDGNAELEFTGGAADATVDILLGRDATP